MVWMKVSGDRKHSLDLRLGDHHIVGVYSVLTPVRLLFGRIEGLQVAQLAANVRLGEQMQWYVRWDGQPLGTGATIIWLTSVWWKDHLCIGDPTLTGLHNALCSTR